MTQEQLKSLKIGDVVQLNSGSPKMTVYEIEANWIHCNYWNDENKKFQNITLDYAQLTQIEEAK